MILHTLFSHFQKREVAIGFGEAHAMVVMRLTLQYAWSAAYNKTIGHRWNKFWGREFASFSNNLKQIELHVVSQILYSYMVSIYI